VIFLERFLREALLYKDYIILAILPFVLGFAYFWLIFILRRYIKFLSLALGSILPIAISAYFGYQLYTALQGNDIQVVWTIVAYLLLSLVGTFTYCALAIAAKALRKPTRRSR